MSFEYSRFPAWGRQQQQQQQQEKNRGKKNGVRVNNRLNEKRTAGKELGTIPSRKALLIA
jgi:hypothetical protein